MNGGFGLLLDGSVDAGSRAALMLGWDVNNGIARRSWSGNNTADAAIRREMEDNSLLLVTMPHNADNAVIDSLFCSRTVGP